MDTIRQAPDNYAISYETRETGCYTGLWAVPGDVHWRSCRNDGGSATIQNTSADAIADAGFRMVGFLNKQVV